MMNKRNYARLIKFLYYFIWLLILLHLFKGLEELVVKELSIWQIIIVSFQLSFEVIVLSQINSLLNGICIVLTKTIKHPNFNLVASDIEKIDIIIPTRRINLQTLEATLIGFQNQSYPQELMNIVIADDTPEKDKISDLQQLANKYKVTYISKPENKKYKAGMLNLTLPYVRSKFIAFFDYDQIPEKDIISKFIELLYLNPNIDFIQAKKVFRGLNDRFKIWSALLYALYFEVFERTKHINDVVLFAGSTACFRRSVIDAVGGIPEDTFTEDNGLSVKILVNGNRGYYLDQIGSIGTVPETFPLQIAQLWRWSNGASNVLKNNIKELLASKNLKFNQRMEVMATFGISPLVVFIYIYGFSFIPLILTGFDSSRLVMFGISSVTLVPLFAAITYTILVAVSISLAKNDGVSEFKQSDIPGFLFIALASNILVITSGLTGVFGLFGPNSKFGTWTRRVRIRLIASISLIVGIIVEYYAITWYFQGFASAGLLIILGITLFPSFIIIFLVPTSISEE